MLPALVMLGYQENYKMLMMKKIFRTNKTEVLYWSNALNYFKNRYKRDMRLHDFESIIHNITVASLDCKNALEPVSKTIILALLSRARASKKYGKVIMRNKLYNYSIDKKRVLIYRTNAIISKFNETTYLYRVTIPNKLKQDSVFAITVITPVKFHQQILQMLHMLSLDGKSPYTRFLKMATEAK